MDSKLTPELVTMAINQGLLDEDLNLIIDAAVARRDITASRKALNLDSGDRFRIINIRPKYLAGCEVEFVQFEDNWLVCRMLDYTGSRFTQGSTLRLRHTHVGTITRRVHANG